MEQAGMETSVFQINVQMVDIMTKQLWVVFALKIRFGLDKDVFLQEFLVLMEEYGMKRSMLVNAQMELSLIRINVTLSQHAEMGKHIIL